MPSINSVMNGLSGLLTNTKRLDTIGNNIANVNTVAFKANRAHFNALYGVSGGLSGAMSSTGAGPLPAMVGMGSVFTGITRNWNQGPIATTGIATDMAIDGAGFFVLSGPPGVRYTRDGAFLLDASGNLVTRNGLLVQGWSVDPFGTVVQNGLSAINIPLGTLSIAAATSAVAIGGNLDSSGFVATQGSQHLSAAFYLDDALTQPALGDEDLTTTTLWIDDGAGNPIVAFDPADPNRTITLSGITKGGKPVPAQTFAISPTPVPGAIAFGTTLNDFAAFIAASLGLDDTVVNGQSLGGGAAIVNGQLVITGNEGTVQDMSLAQANITVNGAAAGLANPFEFTKVRSSDGESVRTTIAVYDSLGAPRLVDLTFVLQSRDPDGSTTWQVLVESNDPTVLPRVIHVENISFNGVGALLGPTSLSLTVPQGTPPASGPGIGITIDLASVLGPLRALASTSVVSTVANDGAPPGTLSTFAVDPSGRILGGFTNGLTRVLGQLALARFANNDGLLELGDHQLAETDRSGSAVIGPPGTLGLGRVLGAALEQANVELAQEFVDMVQATTGFSAASRVITTADEMIRNLLAMGR